MANSGVSFKDTYNYSTNFFDTFIRGFNNFTDDNISFSKNNLINNSIEDSEFYIRFIIGGFGCIFNLINVLFFFFTTLKNTPSIAHELIAYLNISSLINTLSYLLIFIKKNTPYNISICQLQGFFIVYSEISEISSLTMISLHIFNVLKSSSDEFETKDRVINIILAFVSPFIIALIGYFFNIYGESGYWCWIKSYYSKNIGIIFYGVVWVFLIYSLVLIIMANSNIRNLTVINSVAMVQIKYYVSYVKKVSVFPITLIIFWILPTINRIISIYGEENIEIIELMHFTFSVSLGFFISIASFLFLDWKQIMIPIENFIKKCKKCKSKSNNKITNANFLLSSSDFTN